MEPQPQKEKEKLQRRESAPDLSHRLAKKQSLTDNRSRGEAYIPRPEIQEEEKKTIGRGRWKRWVVLSAAAALILGALQIPHWLPQKNQTEFVLTAADVDQAATTKAREELNAGRVPQQLAKYPKDVLQKIADGEESLYTKRLLPEQAAEIRVDVSVSQKGALIEEDVLTPEHPISQFPAGKDSLTQIRFTVEQPGPTHHVKCWVQSADSGVIYTKSMGQGESDALQVRAQ